jgi:hypothetical protein
MGKSLDMALASRIALSMTAHRAKDHLREKDGAVLHHESESEQEVHR